MKVELGAFLDWYVDGEESAVLVDDRVVVLSALATAVLGLVDGGTTSSGGIAQALIDRFGPPPGGEPEAAVEDAMRSLAALAVVRIVAQEG